MIILLTYPPAFGETSASPFGTKAIWLLNLSGAGWTRENLPDPRKMPYGKLPAIRVDGRIIADSDNIRAHLEQQGHDFDAGMSEIDRATSRAFIRMAEEHIYFHQVMDRWAVEANWKKVRAELFNVIPQVIRGIVTRKLRKNLLRSMHGQGIGRFSAALLHKSGEGFML